ncbi:CAP domain-containing protein [Litchfieldia salsa]|uniref:Cysteine-rich secretory protein family protein n=1 Tax=Litchfieldia salsa TaxID=930152 RepID=A0A1H0RWX4_9BACI|nr:CAP-associated domain-containing protein [Litchfieldia salsa]SDP33428.1 Cysteine-rich secretory protein family protein [Litchfieldia salsa]
MRRFLLLLSTIFFLYASWTVIEKKIADTKYEAAIETLKTELDDIKNSPEMTGLIDKTIITLSQIFSEEKVEEGVIKGDEEGSQLESPNLEAPTNQFFSIFNVELGDTREEVEGIVGPAERVSYNEYGVEWYSYHENYQHFMMVAFNEEDRIIGLYTNQDLITSKNGIELGTPKETVLKNLDEPMEYINKGLVNYQFPVDRDYDMFEFENSYVTIFYDQLQDNTVTAIQLIDKELEQSRKDFYSTATEELKEGFEYQLFDLTNAARVKNGLNILQWDDQVKITARKHSMDMAEKNFFDHINLEGQSPFDRMLEDNIPYTVAGENLALGQFSSIFAHEGLMNSLGHRENILHPDFELLGVGVAFNEKSNPYYTENFYSK